MNLNCRKKKKFQDLCPATVKSSVSRNENFMSSSFRFVLEYNLLRLFSLLFPVFRDTIYEIEAQQNIYQDELSISLAIQECKFFGDECVLFSQVVLTKLAHDFELNVESISVET